LPHGRKFIALIFRRQRASPRRKMGGLFFRPLTEFCPMAGNSSPLFSADSVRLHAEVQTSSYALTPREPRHHKTDEERALAERAQELRRPTRCACVPMLPLPQMDSATPSDPISARDPVPDFHRALFLWTPSKAPQGFSLRRRIWRCPRKIWSPVLQRPHGGNRLSQALARTEPRSSTPYRCPAPPGCKPVGRCHCGAVASIKSPRST
jgi:hypothetical protein